ncbi:unnamed protein product [Heligmosomoides polygyrus]|uniref:Cullin domain-containing protein n=1 Tax=Heligmosomoides polygyrus TaxID=6339 RepID=A0A3P7ZV92_HELPZ|nr:unnamed protein product [Heligmosomoides polygyrus]
MQSTTQGDTGVELKSNPSSLGQVVTSTTTTATTPTRTSATAAAFVLQKGAQKRSLSVFPTLPNVPGVGSALFFPVELRAGIRFQLQPKRSKMSDLSDEMMSDEETAEMFRQAFEGEAEPEYMFEQLIEGPNDEHFDNEKDRDEGNENMVDSRAVRQISRGLPTVKKLTIKNFRRKNDDVADLMATGWLTLEASINAIQTKQHVTTNLEQLYKVVESLCENKMARTTYDKLLDNIRKWIGRFRNELNEKCSAGGVEFMKAIENLWSDYCEQMVRVIYGSLWSAQILIRNVFLYLDRTFILENIDESPIWESSLVIFREEIILHGSVLKKLVGGILDRVAEERAGDQVDRYLLRALLRMLRTLDLYKQAFEDEFLSSTTVHYTRESVALIRSLETVDFLLHIERRIKEENERVDLYLDESTRIPLLARAEKCLISDHMQEIVDNGLALLLNDNRVSDVTRLHALLSRVDGGIALLKTGFSTYIKKVGKTMVMDLQRDPTMVEDLMTFKDKLDVFGGSASSNLTHIKLFKTFRRLTVGEFQWTLASAPVTRR